MMSSPLGSGPPSPMSIEGDEERACTPQPYDEWRAEHAHAVAITLYGTCAKARLSAGDNITFSCPKAFLVITIIVASIIINSIGVAGHLTDFQVGVSNLALGSCAFLLLTPHIAHLTRKISRHLRENIIQIEALCRYMQTEKLMTGNDFVNGVAASIKYSTAELGGEQVKVENVQNVGGAQLFISPIQTAYEYSTAALGGEQVKVEDVKNVRMALLFISSIIFAGIFAAGYCSVIGILSGRITSWCVLSIPIIAIAAYTMHTMRKYLATHCKDGRIVLR